MRTLSRGAAVALVAIVAAACTMKETPAPALTGPSEFALRLALQAVPDSILQDGFSQAVVNIDAAGADGRPVRGLTLRVDMSVGGTIVDFGTLSAKTVVTGDDGRARVTYTAPPRSSNQSSTGTIVTVLVTPIGGDFRGEIGRQVDIRLIPPGIILPPNSAPIPQFTFTPTGPQVGQNVVFDASRTTDDGVTCGASCTYTWDFGDGATGTGVFASHTFGAVGTYQVRLTATDSLGASGVTAQSITLGAGTPPTASFTFSPTNPAINQTVNFNATASTAGTGRRIVSYEWNFGNGRTGSGQTVSISYGTAGSYVVSLTVTDDTGLTATAQQTVTVTLSGSLTASLVVSPATGTTATTYFFDASASTQGASPIVEYRFTFADGSPDVVGPSPTTTHRYLLPGGYTARVTVRDSAGRTATATATVTVQ